MAGTQVQRRRGTTAQHATFTGAEGELTVDTTKDTVVVHDGSTAGGFPMLREDLANNTNVYNTANGQLAGMRNKIINGKMEIAQRGTSFAGVTSAYTLDRWQAVEDSDGAVDVIQSSDAPSSNEFQNSMRLTVTTADTSIAAAQYAGFAQLIEGYNVRDLIGRTFTLSFWVRSAKTGTHCVSFRNSGADRSYVAEYTISTANTWEQKSITVSGGLITAGTWGWTNGVGLRLFFMCAAGSNWQTTAGAWQTGNFLATSNQVNCLDTIGNIFAITGVQLEVGSVATPFEHRPIGTELALCQRYYEKSYTLATAPGTATSSGAVWFVPSNTRIVQPIFFKTVKRAAPSMTFYSTSNGASGLVTNVTGAANVAVTDGGVTGDAMSAIYAAAGGVAGNEFAGHWVASIEL